MRPLFKFLLLYLTANFVGCATLTEDAMTPISLSFNDGSEGECALDNKRGIWEAEIPGTVYVRKSDDTLKYRCETDDGRSVIGGIPSTMGAKIIASAVFIDFGITDAITDKHRKYPLSVVLPVAKKGKQVAGAVDLPDGADAVSSTVKKQLKGVGEAMECTEAFTLLKKTNESETWQINCGDGELLKVRCFDENCYVMNKPSRG